MIAQNKQELQKIVDECKKLATKRAIASAAVGAIPAIGIDIATDVAILINVLPVINEKFGLSKNQINTYDEKFQLMILDTLKNIGAKLAGRIITKEIITTILKKMGVRITTRQVARFLPIIGTAIAGAISFGAMKLVIHQHIRECRLTVDRTLDKKS